MTTFVSSIRDGIVAVNRNWQLMLLQVGAMILSFITFFIIVGLPIAVAFVMFGLDLTDILKLKDAVSALQGSAALLNRYFGMAVVIILSIIIYMASIALLWVFTIGGSLGLLSEHILQKTDRFSLNRFFHEGRRLFMPMLIFSLIMGGLFACTAFILGIIGGGASTIIDMVGGREATLTVFLKIFSYLALIVTGSVLILITLSLAAFGAADIALNGSRAFFAVKKAGRIIHNRPASIGFYGLLLACYIAAGFLMVFIIAPFTLIPLIGPLLYLPYHLVSYAVQGYINLVIMASVLYYYRRLTDGGVDSSHSEEAGQPLPPSRSVEPQEA